MEVKRRGEPPYQIWTSDQTEFDPTIGTQLDPQPSGKLETFFDAIVALGDLSDWGSDFLGSHIKDASGQIVFSTRDSEDVEILSEVGKQPGGTTNLEVIEPSQKN